MNRFSKGMLVVSLVVAVVISGCDRIGKMGQVRGDKFDTVYALKITKHQTKKEILEHLGKPFSVRNNSQGETWEYFYYEGRGLLDFSVPASGVAANQSNKQESLVIDFDHNDVVAKYHYEYVLD